MKDKNSGEWMGGWQAFVNWVVIERPKVIRITVDEWEDLTDLVDS